MLYKMHQIHLRPGLHPITHAGELPTLYSRLGPQARRDGRMNVCPGHHRHSCHHHCILPLRQQSTSTLKGKNVKERIAVNGFPSHSYGTSLAIWNHTVLLATRHKWMRPALTPASKLVLNLPTPEGWKAELTYMYMLPSNAPAGIQIISK